ncbi:hypothetical protein M404DRAFT_33272 [Pisolithus tinctorius Marx 270]|uniref:Uncharacterized protein n=1 Tax=Pisolithus tinctorius Marx 270 TaxID=870435 RepID=A0A0C3JFK7_PISTI|nr:hypothetical protein M404DRAFT_33272 [Pisolithus tinctorius Marx 270]
MDTKDPLGVLALDELIHSCFDDIHSQHPLGMLSKHHDKPAMVEAATLPAIWVRYGMYAFET